MILKDGNTFTPEEKDLSNWRQAYPDLDVDGELSKMSVWADANPSKRKTKTGVRRFIVSWLNRANQQGGSPDLLTSDLSEVPEEVRRDDVIHKLKETFSFFGKTLTREAGLVFLRGLHRYDAGVVIMALDEYMMRGRFCPKPIDITGIADEIKQRNQFSKPKEEAEVIVAPPDVAKAWMWYIGTFHTGGITEGMFNRSTQIDDETAERYLLTINQELARTGRWDVILPEHRLEVFK